MYWTTWDVSVVKTANTNVGVLGRTLLVRNAFVVQAEWDMLHVSRRYTGGCQENTVTMELGGVHRTVGASVCEDTPDVNESPPTQKPQLESLRI